MSKTACPRCADRPGKPGVLRTLPSGVTRHSDFRKPEQPVVLCTICDGEAYDQAMATHEARLQN